jgi:hypothetical protein
MALLWLFDGGQFENLRRFDGMHTNGILRDFGRLLFQGTVDRLATEQLRS